MKLGARVLLFLTPVAHPEKFVDVSIDLLMTATAVLLGVNLYVQSGAATTTPNGVAITISDVVICCGVQIIALVLVFGMTAGLPQVPYIRDNHQAAATVGIPDLVGLAAFLWVIRKLT